MVEVDSYLIISFIPILGVSLLLLHYVLKALSQSRSSHSLSKNFDHHQMEYQSNFYSHPLHNSHNRNQSLQIDSTCASPSENKADQLGGYNSKVLQKYDCKKYLSNCQKGQQFIRQANKNISKRAHYVNIYTVKKLKKHKKNQWKSLIRANFDPTELQTIYEQAHY